MEGRQRPAGALAARSAPQQVAADEVLRLPAGWRWLHERALPWVASHRMEVGRGGGPDDADVWRAQGCSRVEQTGIVADEEIAGLDQRKAGEQRDRAGRDDGLVVVNVRGDGPGQRRLLTPAQQQ